MKHSPPDSLYFEELKPSRRHWLVTDFVLAIEVAKALPVYEQIETKDRLLLLEFVGLINAILLQTYYSYEQNSDTIKAPDGFMPIKTGPKDRPKNKLEIEIFCRSVETLRRVGINRTEYVLLQAIIYCYFAIDGLSDQARSILQKEQEKYTLTLLRYMQNQQLLLMQKNVRKILVRKIRAVIPYGCVNVRKILCGRSMRNFFSAVH
uniref:NR LBD domain-containing protein n=1 Tax=Acrobeloides nanus TaxID=290746 RepID=A0A914D971_9BILA